MKKNFILPLDFIKNIQFLLGESSTEYFESLQQEEITSIRYHPKHKERLDKDLETIPWEPNGQYLSNRPNFALDPSWHAGIYYVQESSSMLTGFVCKNLFNSPIKALDLCAAPGGKTTHLQSVLPKDSLLISNELIPKRNQTLVENSQKWGYSHHIITKGSAEDFKSLETYFDLVVVDAPCSGEGLFRKHPEAMEEWSEENVKTCAFRQTKILHDIISSIKIGGYLCYSTCTFQKSENEDQITNLLNTGLFELVEIDAKGLTGVQDGFIKGTLRCWPHLVKGSGFFIALLKKIAHSPTQNSFSKNRHWNWQTIKKIDPAVEKILQIDSSLQLYQSGEYLKIFPKKYHYDLLNIAENIPITHCGIDAGYLRKGLFFPSYHLIYTGLIHPRIPIWNTEDKEIALDYLRKKDIQVNEDFPNGWAIISWNGISLGWFKKAQNRINNYYPTHWMLRK